MRSCKALPQSSARHCQPCLSYISATKRTTPIPPRLLYSTSQSSQDGTQRQQYSLLPRHSPAPPLAEDPENDEELPRPFRVDPVNKKIETAAGDLPLSPVMDPSFWEARRRHQTPKPRPRKAQNSVERQFRANAFAKALATPVRQCTMTSVRLPNFFLQDFNLVQHPETGKPWWVPRTLLQQQRGSGAVADEEAAEDGNDDISGVMREAVTMEQREVAEREQEVDEEGDEGENVKMAAAATTTPNVNETKPPPPSPPPSNDADADTDGGKPYGPSVHVLARRDLLAAFLTHGSGFFGPARRLFGHSSSKYRSLASRTVVWREDMDAYVLGLMREEVAGHLVYLAGLCRRKGRHYVARCYGWDDVQHKHKGAVLWFADPGSPKSTAVGVGVDDGQLSGKGESENKRKSGGSGPGPFAVFDTVTRNRQDMVDPTAVPVHNMPALLGDELARRVRREAEGVFDDDAENGAIFMLAGRRTTDLQANLWKLQGYLADYRELP